MHDHRRRLAHRDPAPPRPNIDKAADLYGAALGSDVMSFVTAANRDNRLKKQGTSSLILALGRRGRQDPGARRGVRYEEHTDSKIAI